MKNKLIKLLNEIFAPRVTVYTSSKNVDWKAMDKVFGKMDEVFKEMDKVLRKI